MESRKVTETAYFVQITRNEILLRKILGEEANSLRMRNGGEETVANTIFVIFGSGSGRMARNDRFVIKKEVADKNQIFCQQHVSHRRLIDSFVRVVYTGAHEA